MCINNPEDHHQVPISKNCIRSLTSMTANDLTGVNIVKFKTFLKLKNINYTENHSCLIIQIPSHLIAGTIKPDVKVKRVIGFHSRRAICNLFSLFQSNIPREVLKVCSPKISD